MMMTGGDDGSADYLGSSLEVEGEYVVSPPRLALSHQEVAVTSDACVLHQVRSTYTGDRPMEPWVGGQEVIRLVVRLLRQCEAWRPWQRSTLL